MKDIDFLRFYKDKIILDEKNENLRILLQKQSTFAKVVEKDTNFFA